GGSILNLPLHKTGLPVFHLSSAQYRHRALRFEFMAISATPKPNRRKRALLQTTALPSEAVPLPRTEPEYVTQERCEEKGVASQSGEPRPKYGGRDFDSRIVHNFGLPLHEIEPLAVSPRVAWHLLGCGNTHGYELLDAGELESYRDGRSRR